MTTPMIFGLGMTLHCMLSYRLKSRNWRKWLGLSMAALGALALSKLDLSTNAFLIALITAINGLILFSERDYHTKNED